MAILKRIGGLFRHKKMMSEKSVSFPKTELALKILTFLSIVIGGAWGLHLYNLLGGSGWAINIKLEAKVLPYHGDLRLLVVNVKSINSRNTEIELDSKQGDSYEIRFREIPTGLNKDAVINEDSGRLIKISDLLAKDGSYDFTPGLEMDDVRALVVPAGANILVTADLKKMSDEIGDDGKPDFDHVLSSAIVHIDTK